MTGGGAAGVLMVVLPAVAVAAAPRSASMPVEEHDNRDDRGGASTAPLLQLQLGEHRQLHTTTDAQLLLLLMMPLVSAAGGSGVGVSHEHWQQGEAEGGAAGALASLQHLAGLATAV